MDKREIYNNIISDVAMEISISHYWRKLIFALGENEKLCISKKDANELPSYIKQDIIENDLSVDSLIEDESSFDISAISSIFSRKNLQFIVSLILTMSFLNIFIL